MASRSGLMNQIGRLSRWFLKREKVGIDEIGNMYYKKLDKDMEGEQIERRIVAYVGGVVGDPATLPPEWLQWLQRTRHEPPTLAEIEAAAKHRELLRLRAAAKEQEDIKQKFFKRAVASSNPDMNHYVKQLTGKHTDQKPDQ
jgi:NADH dehydrogenase [ubiquinone] 1 alpha subcomplex assembly factor 2